MGRYARTVVRGGYDARPRGHVRRHARGVRARVRGSLAHEIHIQSVKLMYFLASSRRQRARPPASTHFFVPSRLSGLERLPELAALAALRLDRHARAALRSPASQQPLPRCAPPETNLSDPSRTTPEPIQTNTFRPFRSKSTPDETKSSPSYMSYSTKLGHSCRVGRPDESVRSVSIGSDSDRPES